MKIHRLEQRTPEWYALRLGIPTASEFSSLVTSKGEPSKSADKYALTLAGELFAGKQLEKFEGNQWTERGRELELKALGLYAFANDCIPDQVGFITDDAVTMGCSPDALIGDDGMVEIKCLKAERHILAIQYFRKNDRCPTDYVQQTQGQLLIAERRWCDLVFYHPELPLLTIRQTPDPAIFAAIKSAVKAVNAERDEIVNMLRLQANPLEQEAA